MQLIKSRRQRRVWHHRRVAYMAAAWQRHGAYVKLAGVARGGSGVASDKTAAISKAQLPKEGK